jgi:hypothetical protein
VARTGGRGRCGTWHLLRYLEGRERCAGWHRRLWTTDAGELGSTEKEIRLTGCILAVSKSAPYQPLIIHRNHVIAHTLVLFVLIV